MSPYAALVLGLAILGGTAIVAITFRYTPVTLDEISPIDGKVYLGRTYAFDHWTGKMKPAAHSYGTITTAGCGGSTNTVVGHYSSTPPVL
jgi:hypothetical protein